MKILNSEISSEHKPFIVAEISANHNGSLDKALKTVLAAKECGADAIKLQTYTPESMTLNHPGEDFTIKGGPWNGYKLFDLYREAQTPYSWHKSIFDFAKEIGITAFSTPFDEQAVDLLESLSVPVYKIASFEVIDLPLIKYVAKTKKPMIISTGMASEMEIQEAVDTARSNGCEDLILLHCISSYPAPFEQSNLRQIPILSKKFKTLIGLSDHTLGTSVSIASIALGAVLIEKHFTLDRNDKGPDSFFSLEPNEFKQLCIDTNNAWLALGVEGFERQSSEASSRLLRRSIYVVQDLDADQVITVEHIKRIRPGKGLAPKFYNDIIGKRTTRVIKRGTPLSWDMIRE